MMGVRVSCRTTTGSLAPAGEATAAPKHRAKNMAFMPRQARVRASPRQCPDLDTAKRAPTLQLHVVLLREAVRHRQSRLAPRFRGGPQGFVIAGHESPVLPARLGVRVNLEAAVDADLVHVDGVISALTLARSLHEELVDHLLLGRHGRA